MWHPIILPKYPIPIRACSVPINGDAIAIWHDSGVYRIRLNKTPAIFLMYPCEKMEGKFDLKKGQFLSHGNKFVMTGDCGRHGIRTDPGLKAEHRHGDRIDIDQKAKRVSIVNAVGDVILSVPDVDPTDDFFVASFAHSDNANWNGGYPYLIVCDSRHLRAYRYEEDPLGAVPKWKPYGSQETKESLIREIVANPDDDTLRLVYADWLEEHGDPDRAEFIRLQCRIAEREQSEFVSPLDPDSVSMERLEDRHAARWQAEIPKVGGVSFVTPFWRGFPTVGLNSPTILTRKKNTQQLLESMPVESVSFSLWRDRDAEKIVSWPAVKQWRRLELHCSWHEAFSRLGPVLKLQELSNVRRIDFSGWFGDALISSLLKNRELTQLQTINWKWVTSFESRNGICLLASRQKNELPNLKNVTVTAFENDGPSFAEELKQYAKSFANAILIRKTAAKSVTVTRF